MNPNIVPYKNAEFETLWKEIKGYTLVDVYRCMIIHQLIKTIDWLEGDIAEVGVYKGGTARLIARTSRQFKKTVHLFDTFEGMPKTDSIKDIHKEKDFNDTSLEAVTKYLKDCDVSINKGFFPESGKTVENLKFALVHLDVDIYKSVKEACAFFYPRMVAGGIIIVDDYGFPSCPGAKLAIDEFFNDKQEKPIYLPTGQVIIFKTKAVIPAEVDKCRSRLIKYCQGTGIDIGCGGNKITQDAIGIDIRKLDGVTIVRDASDISNLFPNGSLDYVFSSHFLEHLTAPQVALNSWWKSIKDGGYLVLYLPHPDLYKGNNSDHKNMFYPDNIITRLKTIGEFAVIVNQTYSTNNEYSFELVLRKIK